MKNRNLVIGVVAVGLVGLYLYNKNKQTSASTTPQATASFANATGSIAGRMSPSGGVLTGRISTGGRCSQGYSYVEVSYPHPSGTGRMYIWECVSNTLVR